MLDLFGGDDEKEKETDKIGGNHDISATEALIKANEGKNKNVAEITEDPSCCFSDNKDYGYEDFGNSYTLPIRRGILLKTALLSPTATRLLEQSYSITLPG